ncbi:hypothetical protein H3L92_06170 [Neisseria dentiae]|uniref:hypothetical protein n=1 Tax=Neisseria dentiae TaxID=194197 RepID=UPI00117EBDE5|nr:hypothetical protein [Neisseria dentiae]QMT46340.1 hypothetical protein H3L92_06170 [Neisseria dentiae]
MDYPFRLTVGWWKSNTGKPLPDIVRITGDAKLVVGTTFVLNPIIGINILYRLRTAANHIAQQKLGDTFITWHLRIFPQKSASQIF